MKDFPEVIQKFLKKRKYRFIDEFRDSDDFIIEVEDDYILKISRYGHKLATEKRINDYLDGKLPVAKSIFFLADKGYICYLKTKVLGEPLCSKKYLDNPELVIKLLAEAVKMFHSLDVKDCDLESRKSSGDVFVHGNLRLSNILIKDNKISGFVDLSCGGVGFEWQDYAWSIWSLEKCLGTKEYTNRYLELLGIEFEQYYYDMVINNVMLEID